MASVPETCVSAPTASWQGWNQAGAQAYYACRYFSSVQDTNFWRNIIAGIQAATQIYFADKQYDTAKQAQNRLDNISNIELSRSGTLFGQFTKQIGVEDAQLADAASITVPEPNYADIRLRVTASVTRQFTEARRKVAECYPVSCMEARCEAFSKLETEQAKAIASEVEQAYQRERALWELRTETKRAHRLQVLQFGRGALSGASAALQGAQAAIAQSASINPYSGWIQAINGIAQTAQGITMQDALAFRGMGANVANSWSLGRTANNTATPMLNSDALMPTDTGNPMMLWDGLERNGSGTVPGDTFMAGDTKFSSPLENIG